MSEWINLQNQRPPETVEDDWDNGTTKPVLGFRDGQYTVVTWTDGEAYEFSSGDEVWITHWMPLAAPSHPRPLIAKAQDDEAKIAAYEAALKATGDQLYREQEEHKAKLAAAQAELAKAQETIQQRERELEEIPWKAWYRVREVLESGHGDDHGAIMDAVLNVHSARAQRAEAKKEG